MKAGLIALLALLGMPASANAEATYIGVFIGSKHFGNDVLNNFNPGLSYGKRWDRPDSPVEYHVEGGVFYNSYKEISPFLLAGISTKMAEIGSADLRIGASVGTAYYETLSVRIEDRYGIPNIAGFIPIAAITASMRFESTEVRLTAVPPDSDTTAILNLSLALAF